MDEPLAPLPQSAAFNDDKPLPGARAALVLLLAINLFNYIDRWVLASVEPCISSTFFAGHEKDPAAMAKTGSLGSAFLFSYFLLSPVFGFLADRMSRWTLVGLSVIFWSLASGASGLSAGIGFGTLWVTRVFVGVGEAGYGPTAPTIISDLYPLKRRGSVLSWFYMAIPVGSALGFALGAAVVAMAPWPWAFYVVVPPGLLLGVLCFFMKDPPRGQADPGHHVATRRAHIKDYMMILKTPSYLFDTLGMTLGTFAVGGIAFWMPRYLSEDRHAASLASANLIFSAIIIFSGLVATLLGGIVGDKLRKRTPGAYFLVSGFSMLASFPLFVAGLYVSFPWAWACFGGAIFFLFFNTGPANAILVNVIHPSMRATAFALNILIIHLFGDAASPPLIGAIAGKWSTNTAFLIVSGTILLGAFVWLLGAPYLKRDTELAPTRIPATAEPANNS